jgi:hypothetical protein
MILGHDRYPGICSVVLGQTWVFAAGAFEDKRNATQSTALGLLGCTQARTSVLQPCKCRADYPPYNSQTLGKNDANGLALCVDSSATSATTAVFDLVRLPARWSRDWLCAALRADGGGLARCFWLVALASSTCFWRRAAQTRPRV